MAEGDEDPEAASDRGGETTPDDAATDDVILERKANSMNPKEQLACQEDIVCVSAKDPSSVSDYLRIIQSNESVLEGEAMPCSRGEQELLALEQEVAKACIEKGPEPSLSNCLRLIQRNELGLPGAHAIVRYDPTRTTTTRTAEYHRDRQRSAEPPPIHGAVVVRPEEEQTAVSTDNQQQRGDKEEVLDAKVLTPVPNSQNSEVTGSPTTWLGIFAVFTLLLGLLLLLILLLPSRTSSVDNTEKKNPGPRQYRPFRMGLPAATVKAIREDKEHPFSKANAWMWNDPHRKSYSIDRQWQRFHLVAFYYFAGGDEWHRKDGWLDYEGSECDWFSQHFNESIRQYDDYPVCDDDGHLIKLSLNSNNLQGYTPDFRNLFPLLQTLDVGNNRMHGPPPDAFVETLEVYVIAHNMFEGQFLGNGRFDSTKLRVVQMQNNRLYGHNYGPNFAFLSNLERMDLSNNHFDEILTDNLGQCKKLTHLLGGGNRFRGTIPTEVGLITNLQQMDFSRNAKVHGPIPSQLGMLTVLELCNASGTSITGSVPSAWCQRIRNGQLVFDANCSLVDCCT